MAMPGIGAIWARAAVAQIAMIALADNIVALFIYAYTSPVDRWHYTDRGYNAKPE
jgi:hypothetical protein